MYVLDRLHVCARTCGRVCALAGACTSVHASRCNVYACGAHVVRMWVRLRARVRADIRACERMYA